MPAPNKMPSKAALLNTVIQDAVALAEELKEGEPQFLDPLHEDADNTPQLIQRAGWTDHLHKDLFNQSHGCVGRAMPAGNFRAITGTGACMAVKKSIDRVSSFDPVRPKVACPEEIAYRSRWIDIEQVQRLIKPLAKNGYGQYLQQIIKDDLR